MSDQSTAAPRAIAPMDIEPLVVALAGCSGALELALEGLAGHAQHSTVDTPRLEAVVWLAKQTHNRAEELRAMVDGNAPRWETRDDDAHVVDLLKRRAARA